MKNIAGAGNVIAAIVALDQSLAQIAINNAMATAGADSKKILEAQNEMAKAGGAAARGNAHQEIECYKHAWQSAMEAMKKAVDLEQIDAKMHALNVLKALLLITPKPDADKIADAINKIAASLDPVLWAGDHRLTKDGGKVFDNDKAAVHQLAKVTTVNVLGVIVELAGTDAALALAAIDEAVDAGGHAGKIADARKKMTEAAALLGQGKTTDAIGKCKDAWQGATEALK